MSLPPNYDIRFSESTDVIPLMQWFTDPAACDGFPFNPDESMEALRNWIGFAKFKASLTATIDGEVCAVGTLFLMPYRKVAHHCSFYLMVAPKHRRQGVGASMVRNLLHLAKTRFRLKSLHAELYEPSPLLSVLLKEGFTQYARQENFVKTEHKRKARLLLGRELI